jgi:hypothetical protein
MATTPAKKPAANKPAGKKPPAKKPPAKKPPAKKPAAKKSAQRSSAKKSVAKKPVAKSSARKSVSTATGKSGSGPVLLSGGNPQIPKGDGDGPVQAYIAAMPGWKRDVGRRIDALVAKAVPDVRKAVKWNSPLYGIDDDGWFLSYHCFDKYVKLTFFRGTSLEPVPPEPSKTPETRYFHIREDDPIDEKLLTGWIRQASTLPGERL